MLNKHSGDLTKSSGLQGGGGDPELGLRDLAALRSQTFAISSYPSLRYDTVELRYAKLCYGIRYDTLRYVMICNISNYYVI